jgi:hypothetical protein
MRARLSDSTAVDPRRRWFTVRRMPNAPVGPSPEHRLVFVCGLHRSGTTPLARVLAQHPDVSGFSGTGVPEDEGQHLQDVYPPAHVLGGPGRFARNRSAHLTESSELVTPDAASRLWASWAPHWDLDRRVLVEKSPSNTLMTRFLQQLFPHAVFLVVVRHPVVVTLSTAKWVRPTPLPLVMDNWFAAHETLRGDLPHLSRVKLITYEDLTRRPAETLAEVAEHLDLQGPIPHETLRRDRSSTYEERWEAMRRSRNPLVRASRAYMVGRYAERANTFGYSLTDLEYQGKFEVA